MKKTHTHLHDPQPSTSPSQMTAQLLEAEYRETQRLQFDSLQSKGGGHDTIGDRCAGLSCSGR